MNFFPIGFVGRKGHGKSTAGKALLGLGYVQAHPAEPLRDMLRPLLSAAGIPWDEHDDYLTGSRKRDIIPFFGKSSTELQQTLGTEWGRELVKPSLWTDLLDLAFPPETLVFNDSIRFKSEAEWIRSRGGKLIRIVDPRKPDDGDLHISEVEQNAIIADYILCNAGSIIDLHINTLRAVKTLVGK